MLFHGVSHNGIVSCLTQEINSLCSQLAYVYSANRRSSHPFRSLLFTSLNGRTLSRLEKLNDAGYKRWVGTKWWAEDYERLWEQNSTGSAPGDGESSRSAATENSEDDNDPDKLLATPVSRNRVVYLTADSTEVLEELKEGETYVIGGLCDHNRYKVRIGNIEDGIPFIEGSVESLSRQSQGIGSPRGSAPHRTFSIALANKKGPDGQPSF